jgi:UrcA family protein
MKPTFKWITSVAISAAISSFSLSSSASELARAQGPTQTVKAWDLDLAKPADVQTLYGRVQDAANDLCSTEAKDYYRSARRWVPNGWTERCVADAVASTVQRIGNPLLAALHGRMDVARTE